MKTASRNVQTLFRVGAVGDIGDGQLLEQFIANRNGAAFEVLLERHGPMVWGVCLRVLGDYHDAEEAFQAAFLALVRKAASVSPRESVGNWLYGVARRTALKLKTALARRRARERQLSLVRELGSLQHDPWHELGPVLDQELGRLPERYRCPIVLCDLEGRTRSEAARQLGWPEGTVASRLARGRELLAGRLTRLGVAPSSGALALLLAKEASAGVPTHLAAFTAGAANLVASGRNPAGLISFQVGSLANGAVRIVALKKLLAVAMALAICLAGWGVCYFAPASEPPAAQKGNQGVPPSQPPAAKQDVSQVRTEVNSVLARAIRSVPSVGDVEQRVWILCEVARIQTQAGLDEELGKTLKLAVQAARESESDHRRIDVAAALAEAGQVRHALEIAGAVHRELERERAFSVVAEGQVRAGDIAGALRTAALIKTDYLKGDVLRSVAIAQAKREDFQGSLRTAGTIADAGARGLALVEIAARQNSAKQPGAAETLKQVREIADKLPVVLDAGGEPGDTKPALCCELARVLAASGALDDARQLASSITKSPWVDIAWKNIVTVQSERGESEAALKTADHIRSGYQKGEALKAVVAALVRANGLSQACRVADSIETGFWHVEALLEIARGYARAGQHQEVAAIVTRVRLEAERVKDEPRNGNLKPAAFGRIARAQGELDEEGAALLWIEAEPSNLVKAWSLLGLAEGMSKRLPARTAPASASKDSAPDGDAARAITAAVGTRLVSPPVRKPTGTFKGKILLFGTRREDRPDTLGIEAMNPDGTGMETILILGRDEGLLGARESPDGTRLAFDVRRGAGLTADSEVWSLTAEGHRSKMAVDGSVAAWSPDGTRLATYRSKGREIDNVILDVETGRASVLPVPKTDLVWDWSPDGQVLAVMAGNPDRVFEHPTKGTYPLRQLYLVKPDGTGRELLTTGPMLDSIAACFSPDGKRLAFQERRHHEGRVLHFGVVQGLPHGEPKDLVEFTKLYEGNMERRPHGLPCWSPDGKSIVWLVPRRKVQSAETHPELVIVTLTTGKVDRLDLFQRGLDWVQAIDWR